MSAAGVDAGALLKELDGTWRELGKAEGHGVLRACAMTLLTIARPGDDPQTLGSVLAEIMHEHPCRAIVVRVDTGGEHTIAARASVQCWMPFGRRQQICSEQIEIESPRDQIRQLPAVLLGLLVPDLPIYVWCRDLSLATQPDLAKIFSLAGRIIIDTAGPADARQPFSVLTELRKLKVPVSDLAWTRVTRWRALLDSVFTTPNCHEQLRSVENVEISWAGQGRPAVACYLAAWLKSRLPRIRTSLVCGDPLMPDAGAGRIRRVMLAGPGFSIELSRPGGTVVEISGKQLQGHLLFPHFSRADVLREELGLLGVDAQFEASVDEAVRLAWEGV